MLVCQAQQRFSDFFSGLYGLQIGGFLRNGQKEISGSCAFLFVLEGLRKVLVCFDLRRNVMLQFVYLTVWKHHDFRGWARQPFRLTGDSFCTPCGWVSPLQDPWVARLSEISVCKI